MTILIEFGWVGFGLCDGMFPGICAGLVRIMFVRGGIEAWSRGMRDALAAATEKLRGRAP